jgi:uncharacterized membrane protein
MDPSWMALVGYGGMAVLVVGWLVVSFSPPSPRREIIEWISTCGMYLALLMLFVSLVTRSRDAGNIAATIAFGFLVALFGSGLVVCLFQTLRSLRGSGQTQSSATN